MSHPAGQQFGKYQLLERIAAGGMAEIYRARYEGAAGVTKPVVIKKILPHYAGNKSFISMFINEAKIAVGLSHGNIAQVFDFGEIDGEYFLAMEFVDGQPLSKVMRRAREQGIPVVPTPFALYLGIELCKGLHYAHTRLDDTGRPLNIIHRDVSPQNVIISYEGQVKIVDFGIAKARTAGRTETEAGAVKGKYVYFAPEQARGKDLDARTDVFATGIVLYEMLCGRLPFEGKMIDVLSRIVRGEFARPRLVNPDITPSLERILLTALANDRRDRYPSAQALQEALSGYLYANAPTFSAGSLAQLMSYLYQPELVAEGRPGQLQREFTEQVPTWRKQLPDPSKIPLERLTSPPAAPGKAPRPPPDRAPREDSATPTLGDSASASASTPHEAALRAPPPAEPSVTGGSLIRRLGGKWIFTAVPLVAAALAAGVVVLVGHFGTFAVQLTSEPPGARVQVNGLPAPRTTPLLISDLAADQNHVIQVQLPGRKTWTRQVSPVRGMTLTLHAELEPDTKDTPGPGSRAVPPDEVPTAIPGPR